VAGRTHSAAQLKPVHARHLDIGDHDFGRPRADADESLVAVGSGFDREASVPQLMAHDVQEFGLVVHEQNAALVLPAGSAGPQRAGDRTLHDVCLDVQYTGPARGLSLGALDRT
jgi:hypothetical protein